MIDVEQSDFTCINCGRAVTVRGAIGTRNRNHCPDCLHSKHVDDSEAGDRAAVCHGDMQPIGLTYKQIKPDKYGRARQGEPMIIHHCNKCGKISINRIAADDNNDKILNLLSINTFPDVRVELQTQNIHRLDPTDLPQIRVLLYGK